MYFCNNSISMKYFISAILTILILSCKATDEETITFFGGEIINPKSNFVLFLKDDKVIDTLLLDENNRFLNEYKSLEEGLYTFKHGNEFQYVYLQQSDSVLLRLNTWDFDESLVFSGKGSAKNEFLINLFLQNEKEEMKMYQYFSLDESNFQKIIDSLSTKRTAIYNDFLTTNEDLSDNFKKLATTTIHFPLYRFKEVYPFYYKKLNKLDNFPELSDTYYSYRNNINLNEEDLVLLYTYQNYVISYLYNLSYKLKENDPSKDNITINILNSTVENVELETFKNTLLKKIIINDFFKSESSCSIKQKELDLFIKNCSNSQYITEVNKLVNDSKAIINKAPLQDFNLISYSNTPTTITQVIKDQNSVIYFWSTAFMSSDYLMNRIKYLENKYPNVLFIGINMQTSTEDISNEPNLKFLDINKQFKLTKESFAHNYLTSKYPRTIIVNNKGIVENGFTYLDSRKLSSELDKLK
jgi:thiol-disulfide isomerase/thioredoxin